MASIRRYLLPTALVFGLLLLGLAAYLFYLADGHWQQALQWIRDHSQAWWLPPALILIQVLLYMFALPGPSLLWAAAAIYPPLVATSILVAGGSLGGVAGYLLSRRLSTSHLAHLRENRHFQRLQRQGDFFTLCALRLTPGFPNSIINYGSGILRLPLGHFIVASLIGISVKAFLFSNVIYHAVAASGPADMLRHEIIVPLLVLVGLLFLARFIQRRVWPNSTLPEHTRS